MYKQDDVDYLHDTLIDLLISTVKKCMTTCEMEAPNVGDWCMEISSFKVDNDNCMGKLINIEDDTYTIETIGGKIVTWRNSEFVKIPSEYLRK